MDHFCIKIAYLVYDRVKLDDVWRNVMKSAVILAKELEQKLISPKELVCDTIAKVRAVNERTGALSQERFEQAILESETVDYTQTMFKGMPIVIKDLGQQLKGEKNTSGARLLKDYVSTQTDTLIQKIQALGFIILGQTTTPEFGFLNHTTSQLHGVTRNPLDVTRHAGGSSGGSAALVAGGALPIAMASDGGGSIRIPASFCGLVGLKPSRGRMPVGPGSYRGWQGASANFAVTQTLADTKALFYALQEEQVESPFTLKTLAQDVLQLNRSLRVAFTLESPVNTPVSQEAKQAVIEVVKQLEALGCQVTEIAPQTDGVALMQSYYVMNGAETASMLVNMEKGLGRVITRADVEPMTWLIYQSGKTVLASDYTDILTSWDKANATMCAFHDQFDVFITPSAADVAPKIEGYGLNDAAINATIDRLDTLTQSQRFEAIWDHFIQGLTLTPFTQQANLTGQPAISLPLYQTANGLPIGVHISAKKGREDLLFYVAELLGVH